MACIEAKPWRRASSVFQPKSPGPTRTSAVFSLRRRRRYELLDICRQASDRPMLDGVNFVVPQAGTLTIVDRKHAVANNGAPAGTGSPP